MLVIDITQIPPEGLVLDEPLSASDLHLEGESDFSLQAGARIVARVDKGDEDTIHVQGRLSARLGLACGRCLEPFSLPVDTPLDLFYLPPRAGLAGSDDEEELTERDLVVAYYGGSRLDLGETVREQLLLALPMKRLCTEGCRGLCVTCGANRNLVPCECAPEAEVRWLALKEMLGRRPQG